MLTALFCLKSLQELKENGLTENEHKNRNKIQSLEQNCNKQNE